MEVAPFFVDFHHFLSIFTIFYRFSRFTHFCRDLHFVAIYALFPQIFFGQNSLLRNITRFLHVCSRPTRLIRTWHSWTIRPTRPTITNSLTHKTNHARQTTRVSKRYHKNDPEHIVKISRDHLRTSVNHCHFPFREEFRSLNLERKTFVWVLSKYWASLVSDCPPRRSPYCLLPSPVCGKHRSFCPQLQ